MTWYTNYLQKLAHNFLSDDTTNPGKKVWQTMYDNYFNTELQSARNLAQHFDQKAIFDLFMQQMPEDLKNNNEFKNSLKEYSIANYQFDPTSITQAQSPQIDKLPDELFIYIKTFIRQHCIINQRQNPYENPDETLKEVIEQLYETIYTVPNYQSYFRTKWNKVKQFIFNNYNINIDELNINKEQTLETFEPADDQYQSVANEIPDYDGEDEDIDEIDINDLDSQWDSPPIEPDRRRP